MQAQDSNSMNLLGAIGNCFLAFTSDFEIICALLPDKQVVGVWPLHCLRRYWCEEGVFAFEAGRRSPRGEGSYSFVTSENEDMYRTLDKLIQKAKRDSSSSGSVDERPPAPLPTDAHKSESPIPSSESDEEGRKKANGSQETTPIPSKVPLPQPGGGISKTTSLNHPPNHSPDVSANPTYIRRVRTHTGSKWLHQSVEPAPPLANRKRRSVHNQPLPPPPTAFIEEEIATHDPLQEDTYSHTVHHVPAPFQQSVFNASLYNALVHPQDPSIKRNQRPGSVDDSALYDIAFPPSTLSRARCLLPQDAEYGTVVNPGPSVIPRTAMPVSKLPLSLSKPKSNHPLNPLYGSQEDLLALREVPEEPQPRLARLPTGPSERPDFLKEFRSSRDDTDSAPPPGQLRKKEDDGLTTNPLYGSQDRLLDALKLQALEDSVEVDPARWYMPPESGDEEKEPARAAGEKPVDGRTNDKTNVSERTPLEEGGASKDRVGSPKAAGGGSKATERSPKAAEGGATTTTHLGSGGAQDVLHGPGERSREATPIPSPSAIPRDAKGYSQIDKSKKNRREEASPGEDEEDLPSPPPIPQRNYSWDSTNSNVS